MKIFNNLFNKKKQPDFYTLLTGGHLQYTKDILKQLTTTNPKQKYLILHKNYDHASNTYEDNKNSQVFNFDSENHEDIEDLILFLDKSNTKVIYPHK